MCWRPELLAFHLLLFLGEDFPVEGGTFLHGVTADLSNSVVVGPFETRREFRLPPSHLLLNTTAMTVSDPISPGLTRPSTARSGGSCRL
jgi:hypothetical protein